MKQSTGKIVTVSFIGIVILSIIIYDIFALNYFGRESTISSVLNIWSFEAHPLLTFLTGFVVGGLVIHFFRWKP